MASAILKKIRSKTQAAAPLNKLQIPNSNLQRSTKLQAQNRPAPFVPAFGFRFEIWNSLELGVLVLGVSLSDGSKTQRAPESVPSQVSLHLPPVAVSLRSQ
jgi:hypothetical protein